MNKKLIIALVIGISIGFGLGYIYGYGSAVKLGTELVSKHMNISISEYDLGRLLTFATR